ncbi:GyrI-like domain-containing protein [Klebsiella pneumoniae subsp. pneumoniae]|nr:GyrI-like domain-containing protein [Klebsiella pneumoniae subsp. pneumoniae]
MAWDDPRRPPRRRHFVLISAVRSIGRLVENAFGVINGEIPGGRCAVVRHHGSLDTLANSVWFLYRDWLPASGETLRDFPVYFRYLNFVHEVAGA